MTYLFSENGLRDLKKHCTLDTFYFFDYDGVLAEIHPDPSKAKASTDILRIIEKLSQAANVAVISGRGLEDLQERITNPKIQKIGNHGIEGAHFNAEMASDFVHISAGWMDQLTKALLVQDVDFSNQVIVEDKVYSLSLHYRMAHSAEKIQRALLTASKELNPKPRVIHGEYVLNLVPPGAPNKGTALMHLWRESGCRNAFFIGDDQTDEDVFKLREPGVFGVRINPGPATAASYYLNSQKEVFDLLQKLLNSIGSGIL